MQALAPLPLIDGRFRLLRLLAVGGMGELYLAIANDPEIEGLEQLVVIKRMLPGLAAERDVVLMFLTEARIAARLDHPNVVRVYDMGQTGGSLYFTMEYLHGADLERVFDAAKRRGVPFPIAHAITVALGMCAGLHFAHEMRRVDGRPLGIVHRDVSPGNVFITFNGEIKLVDFGIAKVVSRSKRTEDGILKGKLAYMSPEQVRGEPIDRRSDIYAIGILLYELLTLTHAFDDDNEYKLMEKVARGDLPPLSTHRRGVPPELEQIVMTAVAPDREQRYPTARRFADELRDFAKRHDINVSTPALKQYLEGLIDPSEYPWYLDEEGPEERAAVQTWFASVTSGEVAEEVEILDVRLDDLMDDPADEPEPDPPEEPEEPEYYDEQYGDESATVVRAAPTELPIHRLSALHARPRPPAWQSPWILAALVLLLITLLIIVMRRSPRREPPVDMLHPPLPLPPSVLEPLASWAPPLRIAQYIPLPPSKPAKKKKRR